MADKYESPEIRKLELKDLHLLMEAICQGIEERLNKVKYYPGLQTNLDRIWRGRK